MKFFLRVPRVVLLSGGFRCILCAATASAMLLLPSPSLAVCGDGILDEPEETCDDGNTVGRRLLPTGLHAGSSWNAVRRC